MRRASEGRPACPEGSARLEEVLRAMRQVPGSSVALYQPAAAEPSVVARSRLAGTAAKPTLRRGVKKEMPRPRDRRR